MSHLNVRSLVSGSSRINGLHESLRNNWSNSARTASFSVGSNVGAGAAVLVFALAVRLRFVGMPDFDGGGYQSKTYSIGLGVFAVQMEDRSETPVAQSCCNGAYRQGVF
jgi:hypothetical protein